MTLKTLQFRNIYYVLLVCFFVAVTSYSFFAARPSAKTAPTDDQLIAVFRLRRQLFERLQQMNAEDMREIFSDLDHSNRLNKARQMQYERLESEIQNNVLVGRDRGSIRFIFGLKGVAIGPGWVKGIEYISSDLRTAGIIRINLNNVGTMAPNIYLRQIDTNWFLFYERDE